MKTPNNLLYVCILFVWAAITANAQTTTPSPAIMDYPGPAFHYHVKTAWTDTRSFTWMNGSSKNAIGFIFKETPGAWYFPYNYASPQEVAQANAVYSTLLTALSTGEEISIHIFSLYNGHYYFDQVQIGSAY